MYRATAVVAGIAFLSILPTGCIFQKSSFRYSYEVQVRRDGGLKPVEGAHVVLEATSQWGSRQVEGLTDRHGFCYLEMSHEGGASLHGVFYPCAPDTVEPTRYVVTVTKEGYKKARREFTQHRFIRESRTYNRLSEAIALFQY